MSGAALAQWEAERARAERSTGVDRARIRLRLADERPALHAAGAPVRALCVELAGDLDDAPEGGAGGDASDEDEAVARLRARCFFRLGEVAMLQGDLSAADAFLERAADRYRILEDLPGVFLTHATAARLLLRQARPEAARELLDQLVADLDRIGEALGQRQAITLSLAMAESALDDPARGPPEAREPFAAALVALEEIDEPRDEDRFTALEGLALVELAAGDVRAAAPRLRAAMAICQDWGATDDALRVRLNLGLALAGTGEPGLRGDGHKHLQMAVDGALELGLEHVRIPALVGLAGMYAAKGATVGALDRILEVARAAVDEGNPRLYADAVALMAEIYAQKGDHARAFLTLAKGRAALLHTVGPQAAALVEPHFLALRDHLGQARYDALCARIVAAQEARKALDGK